MTPSEILSPLRNDGRSRHHQAVFQAELDRIDQELVRLKAMLDGHNGNAPYSQEQDPLIDPRGGS